MRGFLLVAILISLIFSTKAHNNHTQNYVGAAFFSGLEVQPFFSDRTDDYIELFSSGNDQPSNLSSKKVVTEEQKAWIKEMMEVLLNTTTLPAADTIAITTNELDDFRQSGFRLKGTGYIHFENGDWIYLVSNSSHTNEKIGDITLAMDNKKRFYLNEGHVCGGIIHFTTGRMFKTLDADMFFRYFRGDEDETEWKALTIK
jgi:hypothetical protein